MKAWTVPACVSALALALVVGCSSDAFGPVGRSLPPEVKQDSLGIEISIPVSFAESFQPDGEASEYAERRALVFGSRLRAAVPDRSYWRSSMLMRFDFQKTVELLPVPPVSTWKEVSLELQRYKADEKYGASTAEVPRLRDIDIFTLATSLDSTMQGGDLSGILDQKVQTETAWPNGLPSFPLLGSGSVGSVDTMSVLYGELKGWLAGQPHAGFALVDQSVSYPDTLVETFMRFASDEFPRSRASLLPTLGAETIWQPHLRISYDDPTTEFEDRVSFRPALDLSYVEREEPPADRLRLGTYPNHWIYLDVDLAGANIPSNATITEAHLALHVDGEYSLLRATLGVRAVETTAAAASGLSLFDIERNAVARSLTFIGADEGEALIDVTEFVQRYINGLLDDGTGILLVQTSLDFDLVRSLEFYGVDAADASRRPRLIVEFTPPPDFQR